MSKANYKHFGITPDGDDVEIYTLQNAVGMQCKILTYGGIISEWSLLDEENERVDIVLGFSDFDSYLGDHPHFGAITGRVAGRISAGKFSLDGVEYDLEINDPPNHLHGGSNALDKKVWAVESADRYSLTLSYLSPDGEQGYPGNVIFKVKYILTENGELSITHQARTDKATPINLTCHAYFNLTGHGASRENILGHRLKINGKFVATTDEQGTLLGKKVIHVDDGASFQKYSTIREALPLIKYEHGDLYFLDNPRADITHVANVTEPKSGRKLDVYSTNPCLQLYLGKHISAQIVGKHTVNYGAYAGLCLECQGFSNGVNSPDLGDIILRQGQLYSQKTIYHLSN